MCCASRGPGALSRVAGISVIDSLSLSLASAASSSLLVGTRLTGDLIVLDLSGGDGGDGADGRHSGAFT